MELSDNLDMLSPYMVKEDHFDFWRKLLNGLGEYKFKFSHSFNLSKNGIGIFILQIALESHIENEMLMKNEIDPLKYYKLLVDFNKFLNKSGYKSYYDTGTETEDKALNNPPTIYFKGHSDKKDKFYAVSDFLPVNSWITPRYYRPRLYYKGDIPKELNCVCIKPTEWPSWTPAEIINRPSFKNILTFSVNSMDRQIHDISDEKETIINVELPGLDINELTISAIRSNGKLKLNNKMVHLTYSYQPNLEKLHEHLEKIIKKRSSDNYIVTYSMVHENGKHDIHEKHPHTHVAIMTNLAIQTSKQDFFDYTCPINPPKEQNYKHPNIRPVKYKKHWIIICSKYHKKEGGKILTNFISDEKEVNCNYDLVEAVAIFKREGENGIADYINRIRPNDISRIGSVVQSVKNYIHNEKLTERKEADEAEDVEFPFNKWHEYILHHVMPFDSGRTLIWIYDTVGCEQKTDFAKYLKKIHNAVIITARNEKDVLYSLIGEIEARNGDPIKTVIFDIPRAAQLDDMYTTMELVKNGEFTVTKYASKNVNLGCKPTVIVMSNESPDIKKCSIDRWTIFALRDGMIEHFFADELDRMKYSQRREIVSKLASDDIRNKMVETFHEPIHVWPIELFTVGKQYIGLINEIFLSHKYPKIICEPRLLKPEEKMQRRVNMKSCSDFRKEIFGTYDNNIVAYHEISYRPIFPNESISNMVWDVTITARDMTPEEIDNFKLTQQNILNKKTEYKKKQLELFKVEYTNKLINYNNENN